MSVFPNKLNTIANNTNSYLKSFFSKQKKNSHLLKPMKYGVFSGEKDSGQQLWLTLEEFMT